MYVYLNLKIKFQEFTDGSAAGTPHFHHPGPRFDPQLGNWEPTGHIVWPTTTKSKSNLVSQSCSTLCNPGTVAYQALLSMGFSRQEYWSGLPCPSPGDLPDPGIGPRSPELKAMQSKFEPSVKACCHRCCFFSHKVSFTPFRQILVQLQQE